MDDPNMHAYGEDGPDDAEIGRQWREDSSLEKWFPLTAARLIELETAEHERDILRKDLQYARDGLKKGRSRMREDNERLRTELQAAKKTPLDPLEIEELWDEAHELLEQGGEHGPEVHELFARLIERAHGIGA